MGVEVCQERKRLGCSVERPLRAYGRFVGRFAAPVFLISWVVCIIIALTGWITKHGQYVTDLPFEKQWSVRGGKYESEYDSFTTKHDTTKGWQNTFHITMILPKDEGDDVFTPDVWDETETLFGQFFGISVTTSANKTYSAWDLCARGSSPDKPSDFPAGSCAAYQADPTNADYQSGCASTPYLPCQIVSPNNCFGEFTEYLHPSYLAIDPIANLALPAETMGVPYTGRPLWRNLTAKEMKRQASNGCTWYTELGHFSPAMWAANIEWNENKTEMMKVGGLRWTFYMEAPTRAAFRMSLTQPEKADENEISEALDLFSAEWMSRIETFNNGAESVSVSNLKPDYLESIEEELEEPPWVLGIVGAIIMLIFVTVVLVSFSRPLESRAMIGGVGLATTITGAIATGGLIMLFGYKWNSAMMAVLPFLALGLGVNDGFVLIRYFSELGTEFIAKSSDSDVIGEVFSQAGAGVILTSICNTIAFALGSMLPVPGMSDVCVGFAVVSAVNFLVVITQFLAALTLEARRIRAHKSEPLFACCQKTESRKESNDDSPSSNPSWEERFNVFLEKKYAPCMASPIVASIVSFVAVGLLAICCWLISVKDIGYRPAELVNPDLPEHAALRDLFDHFTYFQSSLVLEDDDVPGNQGQILDLYKAVSSTENSISDSSSTFLTTFYLYLLQVGQATGVNYMDATYQDSTVAPYGIGPSNPTQFYSLYHAWNNFPLDNPAAAFAEGGDTFIYADMVRANEFTYFNTSLREIEMAFMPFFQVDLSSDKIIVDSIEKIRKLIDDSPLADKAYPHGEIFTYWQVFLDMEPLLWRILGINLAVIFCATLLLLHSPLAAVVAALSCSMFVLQLYGICMIYLKFNVFIAASLLAIAGMSVEFTVHVVAAFALQKGSVEERLGKAMRHTFMATALGSLSTMFAIIPMAFHPIDFVVKYQFSPFAISVWIGLINGLIFLPGFLALAGKAGEYFSCCFSKKLISESEDGKASESEDGKA